MNIDNAKKKLADLHINPDLTVDILESAKAGKLLTGSLDEIDDGIKSIDVNSKGTFEKVKLTFKGLGHTIKNFATSSIGMATIGIVGLTASLMAVSNVFDYLNKNVWKTDYNTNKQTANTAISNYDSTIQELESVNKELSETKTRINELESKDSLTFVEETELDKLKLQNNELKLQQQLLKDAEQARKNVAIAESVRALQSTQEDDVYQARVDNNIGGMAYADGNGISAERITDAEQIKRLASEITSVNSQIKKYQELASSATDTKDIEKYNKKVQELSTYQSDLNSKLSERVNTATEFYSQIAGNAEYAELSKEYEEAFDAVNNMNLSDAERELAQIESYFSDKSHNYLAKKFKELGKEGKLTEKDLNKLGLRINEIGDNISLENLLKYFNDMQKSAEETSKAVKSLSETEKIGAVSTALETVDAGANYETAIESAEKIKELYSQGLVGKDEFKAFSDYLSYGADASIEAYEQGIKNFNRYFTQDTATGVKNFLTDLEAKSAELGTDWLTRDENGWNFNLDNLALAAKEMGIGVGMFEDIIGRLEDYDFDIEWTSAIEGLSNYQSALSGIKDIYEDMEDGDAKEALKLDIEEWEKDLELYEDDLSQLDEEKLVKIQLKYESLQTQEEIDSALAKARASGSTDEAVNQYANAIVANEDLISSYEESFGLNKSGVTIPIKPDFDALYEELALATKNEERIEIQAEIIAQQDKYKAFLDGLANEEITLTPDMSVEEINEQIDAYIEKKRVLEFEANADKADAMVQDFKERNKHNPFNLEMIPSMDISDVEELLDSGLSSEVTFRANVDGVEETVSAIKNEDGTITYTTEINGELTELELNQYGTLTRVVNEVAGEQVETVDSATGVANFDLGTYPTEVPDAKGTVNFKLGTYPTYLPPITQTVYEDRVKLASGTMLSPAHAYGTGYNAFNLISGAYARGQVSLSRNEDALVNELGQESIIRNGRWFLLPSGMHTQALKKGDIVLSAEQTKALLKTGRANGHGKAYANGTIGNAISNAYDVGSVYGNGAFKGGASGYNYGSGSNSGNSNSNSNNNNNDDSNSESAEKLDWIAVLLSRIQRVITNIGKVASATFKSWTERSTALESQISSVKQEMEYQKQGADRYLQEANSVGLSDEYAKKVQDGTIDIESIEDETLREQIQEYQQWFELSLECTDAVQELEEELYNLSRQKFDNVIQQYDDRLAEIEHSVNILDSLMEQTEAKGYILGASFYKAQQKQEEKNLETLMAERSALQQQLNNSGFEKGTEEWNAMNQEIMDVEESIQDTTLSLIELNNELRQLEWDSFEKMQDLISSVATENDFYIDLMSNNKMFDTDTGAITDGGMATLGLHASNMNVYMAQADEYAKKIEEISKEIASDPYNQTLIDQRKEWIELQQDSIKSAEDEKQAMKDLAEDGFNVFLDLMSEVIDKRKEMMQNISDLYDFEKSISESNKEISSLQKQIESWYNDDSEEGRLNKQKAQVSLEEEQQNLQEQLYDKYIQDQEKMLDDLYSSTEEWVNQRLDNIDALISGMIDAVNANSSQIGETIKETANEVGITLSKEMLSIWDMSNGSYGSVVSAYYNGFTNQLTTVNTTLDTIRVYIADMLGHADEQANSSIKDQQESSQIQENATVNSGNSNHQEPLNEDISKNSDTGNFTIGSTINASGAKIYAGAGGTGYSQYFADDPIYTVIGEQGDYVRVRWHKASSGSTGWFKKSDIKAYKNGGLVDYTGLAWMDGTNSNPETVLDAEDTRNLINLTDALEQLGSGNLSYGTSVNNPLMSSMYQPPKLSSSGLNYNVQFGDVLISGVSDLNEFEDKFVYSVQNSRRIQNVIWDTSVGRARGNNSLNRYRN